MTERIGKAAEQEWIVALENYAKRHGLTVSGAALEFGTTTEAGEIYKRIVRSSRSENVSKASGTTNASIDVLAKSMFPGEPLHIAVTKYLETPAGAETYAAMVSAKTGAEQGA